MCITSYTINGHSISECVSLILLIMYFQYTGTHLLPMIYMFTSNYKYACVVCLFPN